MAKRFVRITGNESAEDRKRRDAVRRQVRKEFPPKRGGGPANAQAPAGIGVRIREVRTAQGLTWYAVAKMAGIPNSGTVRAIEEGRDAKLSSVEAIAEVLGLRVTAIKASAPKR